MTPVFEPKPILIAGRHVRLEPLERRHLPALVAAAQDPEIFQYFIPPPLGNLAAMTNWLESILKGQAAGTEVGWGLHPDAQGKGYGVEAATATIDYAFDVLGWTDVIHTIDPDNTPSQRLAERIGSRNLGPARLPPPFDQLIVEAWGQSREEWRARTR